MSGKYSHLFGELEVNTLSDFFRKNPAYKNIFVPVKEGKLDINSRCFSEDVPFTLVPVWDVSQVLGIKTPVLE